MEFNYVFCSIDGAKNVIYGVIYGDFGCQLRRPPFLNWYQIVFTRWADSEEMM